MEGAMADADGVTHTDVEMQQEGQVQVEGESRYGIASMDTIDEDEEPTATTATHAPQPPATAPPPPPRTVASYAHAVGVIVPPPELKAIIDRTADYVRRVGPQFEEEILARNRGKKQFQFLENPQSPYHAYYKQRVQWGEEGPPSGGSQDAALAAAMKAEQEAKELEESKARAEAEAKAALPPRPPTLLERMRKYIAEVHEPNTEEVAEMEKQQHPNATTTMTQPPTGPTIHPSRAIPSFTSGVTPSKAGTTKFSIKHPGDLYSAIDIDVIKLTALYVARSGNEFLSGLQKREQRNPYFDFIKPRHALFVFFQHLVEMYSKIILPPRETKMELERIVNGMSRHDYLKQLRVEAELKKHADEAAAKQKASEEGEEIAQATIDWHDFVVVESLNFRPEEDAYLPPPRNTVEEMEALLSAASLNETQPINMEMGREGIQEEEEMEVDEEMETDETYKAQTVAATAAAAASEQQEVEKLIHQAVIVPEGEEEQLEIRTDMEEAEAEAAAAKKPVYQKCIVCGDEIAIDDLAEHMRIELLDPRWKEQKQSLLDKQRESSLAADSFVSRNLSKLARRVLATTGTEKDIEQRTELKARKQALTDAILLYGEESRQANEARAKLAEIEPSAVPPKPTSKPAAPAPAPIGPSAAPRQAAAAASSQPPPPPSRPAPSPPAAAAAPSGLPRPPPPQRAPPPPPTSTAPPAAAHAASSGVPPGIMRIQPPGFGGAYPPPPPGAALPHRLPPPPGPAPAPAASAQPTAPAQPSPPPSAAAASASAHPAPPAAAEDQPAAKKQRVSALDAAASTAAKLKGPAGLIPESVFLSTNPPSVSISVQVPNDPNSAFNFKGQSIPLQLQLKDPVQTLKDKLSHQLNLMPTNKMKLQMPPQPSAAAAASGGHTSTVHLNKDDVTLAFYNVADGATLTLGVKERGGKKK